jgi:hypothetical protein
MVTYTSTTSMRTALIDAQSATVDRHRPALSFSPIPASHILDRLIDVQPRTMAPVFAAVTGEVRPDAADSLIAECKKSPMSWHRGATNTTTVIGGFGFDRLVDDIQIRVGPPPPLRRPSV